MNRAQIIERNKASLGLRFVNNLVDEIILNFVPSLVLYGVSELFLFIGKEDVYKAIANFEDENVMLNFLIAILISVLYYYLLEYYNKGRTLGKHITGTMAVSLIGETITYNQIWKRTFSRLVPFDALSFLGTNGWHDSWSDTRVVKITNFENEMRLENEINSIGKE